ncbi:hypothetical protein HDU77_006190 [Chytriomyces hyalinus]|nr:hypothetical protein HDU77_006190 [Chytriomyces hyalinus]
MDLLDTCPSRDSQSLSSVALDASDPALATSTVKDKDTLIATLENRLKDLQAQHKAAAEEAAVDLAKKNALIDKMRIKLNRYEFALKEAVLFLSKPMHTYDAWLNNKNSEANNTLVVTAIQGAINSANISVYGGHAPSNSASSNSAVAVVSFPLQEPSPNGHGNGSNSPNLANPNTNSSRSRTGSNIPPSSSTKGKQQVPAIVANQTSNTSLASLAINTDIYGTSQPSSPQIPSHHQVKGPTNLEIHCLECMRLSLNYLKNAQASIDSIENDDEISLPPAEPLFTDPFRILDIKPLDEALRNLESSLNPTASSPVGVGPPSISSSLAPNKRTDPHSRQGSISSTASSSNPPVSSAVAKSRALAFARLNSPERRHSHHITTTALFRAATLQSPTSHTMDDPNNPLFDDGDISNTPAISNSNVSSNQGKHSNSASNQKSDQNDSNNTSTVAPVKRPCPNCRDYMLQLNHAGDTIETLRIDIKTLANQLEEEHAMRDRTQLAKDILDQELEELTAQLFDQANKMVIEEARMRDALECSNRDLKGELKALVSRCEGREDELKDLKRSLKALEKAKTRSSVLSLVGHSSSGGAISRHGSLSAVNIPGNLLPRSGFASHSYYGIMGINPSNKQSWLIPVDGILLSEFQDHIRQVTSTIASQTNPNPAPATTAYETLFFKRCIVEDIEPCLFAAYPTLIPGSGGIFSTAKLSKGGMNGMVPMKKRILDCFLKSQIESFSIAENPASPASIGGAQSPTTSLSGLTATSASPTSPVLIPKTKCISCTLTRECEYRLRFTDKNPAEFFQVCSFCHDRVACVLDFYAFMGHLRQGIVGVGGGASGNWAGKQTQQQGVSLVGLFRHALWLKRRMAVARVGNCGLFEPEMMSAVDRKADGEWEKLMHIVQ